MPIDPSRPNLTVSLPLDRFAPRAVRHHVRLLDSPSPDLRDAIVLLTSELVSRAVERAAQGPGQAPPARAELRVWMPEDVVRVEVRAPPELLGAGLPGTDVIAAGEGVVELDGLLFGHLADRWSAGSAGGSLGSAWFEIDRHATRLQSGV
jgi:hypothetical protein